MKFAMPDEDWNLTYFNLRDGNSENYMEAFNDPRRLIDRFYFRGGFVSTVFLVIEHSFGEFFETAFFYDDRPTEIVRRYTTYRSAIDGHESLTMNLDYYLTIPRSRLKRERKKLLRSVKVLMDESPVDFEMLVTANGKPLRVVNVGNDLNHFSDGIEKVLQM